MYLSEDVWLWRLRSYCCLLKCEVNASFYPKRIACVWAFHVVLIPGSLWGHVIIDSCHTQLNIVQHLLLKKCRNMAYWNHDKKLDLSFLFSFVSFNSLQLIITKCNKQPWLCSDEKHSTLLNSFVWHSIWHQFIHTLFNIYWTMLLNFKSVHYSYPPWEVPYLLHVPQGFHFLYYQYH